MVCDEFAEVIMQKYIPGLKPEASMAVLLEFGIADITFFPEMSKS